MKTNNKITILLNIQQIKHNPYWCFPIDSFKLVCLHISSYIRFFDNEKTKISCINIYLVVVIVKTLQKLEKLIYFQ